MNAKIHKADTREDIDVEQIERIELTTPDGDTLSIELVRGEFRITSQSGYLLGNCSHAGMLVLRIAH